MIKKYTAWAHETHELVDSERDDFHVLVKYSDYLDLAERHARALTDINHLIEERDALLSTAKPNSEQP